MSIRAMRPWWVKTNPRTDVLATISRIEARLLAVEREMRSMTESMRKIAENEPPFGGGS